MSENFQSKFVDDYTFLKKFAEEFLCKEKSVQHPIAYETLKRHTYLRLQVLENAYKKVLNDWLDATLEINLSDESFKFHERTHLEAIYLEEYAEQIRSSL